uniref:SPASM domain-containing protein n=1 Tax=Clostridium butanoliproducens TaxID=2991837 RepID=UPI0024BAD7A7
VIILYIVIISTFLNDHFLTFLYYHLYEELKLGNIREKSFKDIWLYSDLKKTLGDLTVDEFENCKNCEIRYFCGGGCRGTAFNSSGNIMSSPPNCQEKKKTIYSYLWDFADKDNLFDLLRKV